MRTTEGSRDATKLARAIQREGHALPTPPPKASRGRGLAHHCRQTGGGGSRQGRAGQGWRASQRSRRWDPPFSTAAHSTSAGRRAAGTLQDPELPPRLQAQPSRGQCTSTLKERGRLGSFAPSCHTLRPPGTIELMPWDPGCASED